jgi:hypothetical protein
MSIDKKLIRGIVIGAIGCGLFTKLSTEKEKLPKSKIDIGKVNIFTDADHAADDVKDYINQLDKRLEKMRQTKKQRPFKQEDATTENTKKDMDDTKKETGTTDDNSKKYRTRTININETASSTAFVNRSDDLESKYNNLRRSIASNYASTDSINKMIDMMNDKIDYTFNKYLESIKNLVSYVSTTGKEFTAVEESLIHLAYEIDVSKVYLKLTDEQRETLQSKQDWIEKTYRGHTSDEPETETEQTEENESNTTDD